MYKLIIGNVRVTVADDKISRGEAAAAARQAVAAAAGEGRLLSHIEINLTDAGLDVVPTERTGSRAARKTLKQSMLDGIIAAAREKLSPSGAFAAKDAWYDADTGQEWHGGEIAAVRDELLSKLEAWQSAQ